MNELDTQYNGVPDIDDLPESILTNDYFEDKSFTIEGTISAEEYDYLESISEDYLNTLRKNMNEIINHIKRCKRNYRRCKQFMSATLTLYTIDEAYRPKEFDEAMKNENTNTNTLDLLKDAELESGFKSSDILIDNKLSKFTRSRRRVRDMQYIKEHFVTDESWGLFNHDPNLMLQAIVYQKLYRQGWFLKKNFFKHENTIYYAFTRKDMMRLLDKYISFSTDDDRGPECYKAFEAIDFNEGKDFFELAW